MPATPTPTKSLLHEAGLKRRRLRRKAVAPSDTPPFVAEAASSDDFEPAHEGSGIFGRWGLDRFGLPIYVYELDQYADERAYYPNTAQLDRRDHWHQIGNDRITGLASNDGTIQAYIADRGGTFLNHFAARDEARHIDTQAPRDFGTRLLEWALRAAYEVGKWWRRLTVGAPTVRSPKAPVTPRSGYPHGVTAAEPSSAAEQALQKLEYHPYAYAGGYGYVDDGEAVWSTAFRYRQRESEMQRVFGMGYFETQTTYHNIRVTRQVYAPYGDYPFFLIDLEFQNMGSDDVDLWYYEYWDVNVHQLKLQWLRSAALSPIGDEERFAINELFLPSITWDDDARALRFHQQYIQGEIDIDAANEIDLSPSDIFLADLTGTPDAYFADKVSFFGIGLAKQPEAVQKRFDTIPDAPSNDSMPYCMVLRRRVHLTGGQSATQRYAYGTVRPGASLQGLTSFRGYAGLEETAAHWKQEIVRFTTGHDPVLKREIAWHAYYLLSSSVYNTYYRTHLAPQGSAYLYIHGADGVPRDQALFTLPLVYARPQLARETLKLLMALQYHKTGALPYSFAGHGIQDSALIHDAPSDLDLFFLLAMNEYLAATGDKAFLKEAIPFYARGESPILPPGAAGTSVLDHIRAAVTHLINVVGKGDHGLIKIGDGDWSDGVVFDATLRFGGLFVPLWYSNSKAYGESIPNTQMATYVLPRIAALLAAEAPQMSENIRRFAEGLEEALQTQWNGHWYNRAVLRDALNRPVALDKERINLESQPWALISGVAARHGTEAELIHSISKLLDDPSPTGAPLIENGMIWPAISQLLTWGYCHARPDLAWRSLVRHTFAIHSTIFPANWINIWSGPDGTHSEAAQLGGGTWQSPATPMIDFPVMNNNQHAMMLLGLLRVCGIEPSEDRTGLTISPCVPRERFTLDTALLRVEVTLTTIAGEYRAVSDGACVLTVRIPLSAREVQARVRGEAVSPAVESGAVRLRLEFQKGDRVPFEVSWAV